MTTEEESEESVELLKDVWGALGWRYDFAGSSPPPEFTWEHTLGFIKKVKAALAKRLEEESCAPHETGTWRDDVPSERPKSMSSEWDNDREITVVTWRDGTHLTLSRLCPRSGAW